MHNDPYYQAGSIIGTIILVSLALVGLRHLLVTSRARERARKQRALKTNVGHVFLHPATHEFGSAIAAPTAPVAPGWYPDPFGHAAQRWWSGVGWTEHIA